MRIQQWGVKTAKVIPVQVRGFFNIFVICEKKNIQDPGDEKKKKKKKKKENNQNTTRLQTLGGRTS